MSIKSDRWIRRMAEAHRMIDPFAENLQRPGTISYGVSSYGYDMRVAPEFKIFTNALSAVVDPKSFDPKSFGEFTGDVCIVPPNSFALGGTMHTSPVNSTKDLGSKFLGSTPAESALVKILNSGATRMS